MSGGMTPTYEWGMKNARINNAYCREALAEFLGTMQLCFMVVGSGFQSVLSPDSHAIPVFGTIFGIMVIVIIYGGISGAHLNPAVSLGLAVAGALEWAKLPFYWFTQILGGYVGSLLAYAFYRDHFYYQKVLLSGNASMSVAEYDMIGGKLEILSGFTPVSNGTFLGIGIATEIVLTAILLLSIMGCIDKGNMKIPPYLLPFFLALTVASLGMAHGHVTGAYLNPARDFAPRLAAYTLGWDKQSCFQNINFKGERQEWWIVGIFGPPIGATIGVLMYCFFIGPQMTEHEAAVESQPIYESGAKSENGDWRNTVFIPRTELPPSATSQASHQNGHVPVANGHRSTGEYNSGFIREDLQRQQRLGY